VEVRTTEGAGKETGGETREEKVVTGKGQEGRKGKQG